MLLALDTSTHLAGLALCENGELRAEYSWDVGANHSVELLRRLEWLLKERGLSMTQISAVATTTGPGSFTGVRVAVTVAKTLAFSLRVPLVGMSTLDVLAYSHAAAALPVCALLEAGRGEFYAAFYRQIDVHDSAQMGGSLEDAPGLGSWVARVLTAAPSYAQVGLYWHRQGDYRVLTAEELGKEIQEPTLLCGELRADSKRNLAGVLGAHALFARPLACVRHTSLLAELAFQRLERGELDDPLTLEPLYLRRPAITVSTKAHPRLLSQPGESGVSADTPGPDAGDFRAGSANEQPGEGRVAPTMHSSTALEARGTRLAGELQWPAPERKTVRPIRQAPGDAMGQSGWLA
jgi:tRNA threonylcarbamoyladenosine biosynthesis protein TsaB